MKYKKYLVMVMAGAMVTGMMPVTALAEETMAVLEETTGDGAEFAVKIEKIGVKARHDLNLKQEQVNDNKFTVEAGNIENGEITITATANENAELEADENPAGEKGTWLGIAITLEELTDVYYSKDNKDFEKLPEAEEVAEDTFIIYVKVEEAETGVSRYIKLGEEGEVLTLNFKYKAFEATAPETPTEKTYTVTVKTAAGGTITADVTEAKAGDTVTLTATPNSGYKFSAWKVTDTEGNSVTVTNDKFEMPESNVTVEATFTKKSSGGSSSGGGGSSKPSASNKTETTTNSDGSITTTTTDKNGTVTEITKETDGSTTVVETKKDGTVTTTETDAEGNKTETVEAADGTVTTTETTTDGTVTETVENTDGSVTETVTTADGTTVTTETDAEGTTTDVTVSNDTADENGVVTLPVEVDVEDDSDDAPALTINTGDGADEATITIPLDGASAGTVAVVVNPDGTETIVRDVVVGDDGVTLTVADGTTLKFVDNSKDFDDVSRGDWFKSAVDFASSYELFGGTSADTFTPNGDMTRGMLAVVLHNLANNPDAEAPADFTDVNGQYYENAVAWAAENGIISGYGDG